MSYHGPAFPLTSPSGGFLPQVQIKQAPILVRYGEQALWSTYFFPAGTEIAGTENRLFSTALSSVGQNSTRPLSISETNIKEEGKIPNGVSYDVYGIAAQVYMADAGTDAAADMDQPINAAAAGVAGSVLALHNILNSGSIAWDFTQTKIDVAPLHMIGAAGGIFGTVSADDAGAAVNTYAGAMNNGPGTFWMYRKHPVGLPGSTTFSLLLRFGSRAEAIDTSMVAVRTILFGFYRNLIEIA